MERHYSDNDIARVALKGFRVIFCFYSIISRETDNISKNGDVPDLRQYSTRRSHTMTQPIAAMVSSIYSLKIILAQDQCV
jgi:L-rhamnose isomerase